MDGWTTALIVVSVILVLTLFLFFLLNRKKSRARMTASVAKAGKAKGSSKYAYVGRVPTTFPTTVPMLTSAGTSIVQGRQVLDAKEKYFESLKSRATGVKGTTGTPPGDVDEAALTYAGGPSQYYNPPPPSDVDEAAPTYKEVMALGNEYDVQI